VKIHKAEGYKNPLAAKDNKWQHETRPRIKKHTFS